MIRILQMVGSLNVGGSQAMIINLYKAIDRTKIQFDFVLDHPEENALVPVVEELGAKIYTMPSFKGTNFSEIKKVWCNFFKEHPEYKILHSHVRSYASLYLPIARKAGVTTIIHSHNTANGNGISAIIKAILQYPLRFQADYYFACSYKAGKWLFGKNIIKKQNFKVLYNALDSKKYVYNDKLRNKLREEFDIKNKFVIGHVGRFHPQKNHPFIIDVFAEIKKRIPNATLLLVGDSNGRTEIEEKVNKLGLSDSVIFAGVRNDVPNILMAFDVFLFPSLFEGLPVTVIEAQASGLHCFCSDTITNEVKITELVHFISLEESPAYWSEKINKYTNAYNRVDMSKKIQEAGYDIDSTANFLTSFYENIFPLTHS